MIPGDKVETKFDLKKKMPIWKMVCIDTTVFSISLGLFFTFDYVLPQRQLNTGTIVTKEEESETCFKLPSEGQESQSVSEAPGVSGASAGNEQSSKSSEGIKASGEAALASDLENVEKLQSGREESPSESSIVENIQEAADAGTLSHRPHKGSGDRGEGSSGGANNRSNTNTTQIASDTSESVNTSVAAATEIQRYKGDHSEITINKKVVGTGSDTITYYVADIYLTNIKYLKTAFADDTYGKNIKETVMEMAEDSSALLAINGDFYGNMEEGMVIRNGVLYRKEASGADVCVLFKDGTMKTYGSDTFNAEEIIDQGAWQAWSFGPALLDGNGKLLQSFNTTSYINSENPRCAIGYVEPGHYTFMIVDGRDEGYSRGVTLSELGQMMADEGCKEAYNLDGGKSAAMVYEDQYVNQPADGGRTISDIIYIDK